MNKKDIKINKKPNLKVKIKQFFCQHKNVGEYTEDNMFFNLSGETIYHVCEDCHKVVDKTFRKW